MPSHRNTRFLHMHFYKHKYRFIVKYRKLSYNKRMEIIRDDYFLCERVLNLRGESLCGILRMLYLVL